VIHDGSKVAYVGPMREGHDIGDEGTVLRGEASYSHVKWATGARSGDIEMVRNDHLVVNGSLANHPLTANFESGIVAGINVQATLARRGPLGLLNALGKQGHLTAFPSIAEEALALVASRVRSDPSIAEVLGALEPEDADELVGVAVAVVLKDVVEG
jgi:hypothetical protein